MTTSEQNIVLNSAKHYYPDFSIIPLIPKSKRSSIEWKRVQ